MLELTEIRKRFDEDPVLRGVTLTVPDGQVLALLGPSGSGKTTLLRIIAGLEQADSGGVSLDGRNLAPVPVHRRGFGMVFQDYALFPHKSVAENIAFGLRMHGRPRQEIAGRVAELLDLVGLEGFADRSVFDLSGGEQQRVALARALAPAPRLLLLDEPLGALDRALREELVEQLRQILQAAGGEMVTSIYVTHDQAEAFAIADRVVILQDGTIAQDDSPADLYRRPRSPFVARFLGMDNLLPATIVGHDPLRLETAVGILQVGAQDVPADDLLLLLRPDAARPVAAGAKSANQLSGRVLSCAFRGRYHQVTLESAGVTLKFSFSAAIDVPAPGSAMHLHLDPARLVLLPGAATIQRFSVREQ